YLEKNPPINEDVLRMMMMQMGQKPSQKKINQMMSMMNKNMQDQKKK
ncbi:MAG TPA: YneF family protein, partial [Jeotgalicoccus sp.]|nr:YneF family protein [Jeotgalicoccus sp.]